jgi:hypothetical protein
MIGLQSSMRRNLLRIAGVAVVLVAVAVGVGWRAGKTEVPPLPPLPKDSWSLPKADAEDTAKDLAVMKGKHPWTGFLDMTKRVTLNKRSATQTPARTAPRPAPARPQVPWRLAGVIQRGDESLVLIATGKEPKTILEYKKVGDSLPDGSILVQIMSDSAKTQAPASESSTSEDPKIYRLFDKK